MRISDWSSDVRSSDLVESDRTPISAPQPTVDRTGDLVKISASGPIATSRYCDHMPSSISACLSVAASPLPGRSEEHTSELQSLMRKSYAVFCLKKQNT